MPEAIAVSPHSRAVDLLAALDRRTVSSVELVDMYLDRIDRFHSLNAVVTVDADGARAAARDADRARARGERLGPLHGLPMTIKDALLTSGLRTTGGALADNVPDRDAPAVARLRAAGAIVLGKTNVPTWSGDSQTSNAIFGRTNNPWDADRSPGGSSGGAAAAVAAGLTGAELGSDMGGSIRIPASFCGVAGHKPSQNLVCSLGMLSHPGGEIAELDLAVVGPLARSVADLELLLGVLLDPPRAPSDHPRPWPARMPARVAAWLDEAAHPVSGEVRAVVSDAVERLAAAGLGVDCAARPRVGLDQAAALISELAAFALAIDPGRQADAPAAGEWLRLDAERRRLRAAWNQFCTEFDAVLCPVTATVATPHDGETTGTRLVDVDGELCPETAGLAWIRLATVLHLPATVVPAGITAAGLPVGIMVIGAYLDDWTTLSVARRAEQALGPRPVPPGYA